MALAHVGSHNPVKREAARRVLTRVFPEQAWDVRLVDAPSRVPEQPLGEDVARGAWERAHAARDVAGDADEPPTFGIGIEAGLVPSEAWGTHLDVQACVVVDAAGHATVGQGPGFVYPPSVQQGVLEGGRTVGEAMEALTGISEIGQRMGAIGYLTRDRLDRTELTESAVLMALVPRIRPEAYGPTSGR